MISNDKSKTLLSDFTHLLKNMFFHVIVTSECNLQCKYCFGESLDDFDEDFGDNIEVDYDLPRQINYNVEYWMSFVEKTLIAF